MAMIKSRYITVILFTVFFPFAAFDRSKLHIGNL